jgi:hypothetical protein
VIYSNSGSDQSYYATAASEQHIRKTLLQIQATRLLSKFSLANVQRPAEPDGGATGAPAAGVPLAGVGSGGSSIEFE